eukprot:4108879-Prymnesium_polylepis.1
MPASAPESFFSARPPESVSYIAGGPHTKMRTSADGGGTCARKRASSMRPRRPCQLDSRGSRVSVCTRRSRSGYAAAHASRVERAMICGARGQRAPLASAHVCARRGGMRVAERGGLTRARGTLGTHVGLLFVGVEQGDARRVAHRAEDCLGRARAARRGTRQAQARAAAPPETSQRRRRRRVASIAMGRVEERLAKATPNAARTCRAWSMGVMPVPPAIITSRGAWNGYCTLTLKEMCLARRACRDHGSYAARWLRLRGGADLHARGLALRFGARRRVALSAPAERRAVLA